MQWQEKYQIPLAVAMCHSQIDSCLLGFLSPLYHESRWHLGFQLARPNNREFAGAVLVQKRLVEVLAWHWQEGHTEGSCHLQNMGQGLPKAVTSVAVKFLGLKPEASAASCFHSCDLRRRVGGTAFRVGFAEMNGWRPSMEDAHVIYAQDTWGFFGVFDGHGGDQCSGFIARRINEELVKSGMPESDDAVTELAGAPVCSRGYPGIEVGVHIEQLLPGALTGIPLRQGVSRLQPA